jgi:hypothetical protein
MSATTMNCRAALGSTTALGAMVLPTGAVGAPGPFPGDGEKGAGMTALGEQALRFGRFPSVHNKPQRDLDGRSWRIVRIEVPYCWATPHGGADAAFVRYRIEVARDDGTSCEPPRMTAEQRRLYRKMRHSGVDRSAALEALAASKVA